MTLVNPLQQAIYSSGLKSVADDMLTALIRSAWSANIKERQDASTAVFDAQGVLLAQAAAIPVHLGAMPLSVQAAMERFPKMAQGDVVILNDPFAGGTHLPDLTLLSPVFLPGEKLPWGYLASRAHHSDMGGMSPGSMPLSTEIYQEGFRIPPLLLMEKGKLNSTFMTLLLANVRTPEERKMDLLAQLACHQMGELRLGEFIPKYSLGDEMKLRKNLLTHSKKLMEVALKALPIGEYSHEEFLDSDGFSQEPVPLKVKITLKQKSVVVDFTGSSPATIGGLNAVLAVTTSSVYYCFLSLMLSRLHQQGQDLEDIPITGACFEPIAIVVPEGSVLNAPAPAGVAAGNVETSQRIVDLVLGALTQAVPELIPAASQGTMNNLSLGADGPDGVFAWYETIAGGTGGGPNLPGLNAVQSHMTNTLNTPVEAMEFSFPVRVESLSLREGSGGRGKQSGGMGLEKSIRLLCPATGAFLSERRKFAPPGAAGGHAGAKGKQWINRNGERIPLEGKCFLYLEKDDVLTIQTPGGGGWGKENE